MQLLGPLLLLRKALFSLRHSQPFVLRMIVYVFLGLFAVSSFASVKAVQRNMPDELYEGMVEFELNSGNYFKALVLMDAAFIEANPLKYAKALWGFNVLNAANDIVSEQVSKNKTALSESQRFTIGEIYYDQDNCIDTLKSLKSLKGGISTVERQKRAFYRANCFIKLGSDKRAAKVLTDILAGRWAAYAYYNLAISYAEGSRDKTKALVALKVAASLNGNKTKEERALNDRIYLAAASLYLDGEKNQLAVEFLKKIRLDSDIAAQALYLNGLANLELGDFRSANQSWVAAKKYSLVNQSTSESILAIPYAFERSGYISQALESYLEASTNFENELKIIDKIHRALEKYGAQRVLVDESEISGLEWFLTSDIATNTTRASYYRYLMQNNALYDAVELHAELKLLKQSLEFWSSQLSVFEQALTIKNKNFDKNAKAFNKNAFDHKIAGFEKVLSGFESNASLNTQLKSGMQFNAMLDGVSTLKDRLAILDKKLLKGKQTLINQLENSRKLKTEIDQGMKRIAAIVKRNDKIITDASIQELTALKNNMLSNYERAEQGLIHIFQGIAENKNRLKKQSKKKQGGYR